MEVERETVPHTGEWALPPARIIIVRARHVEWDGLRSMLRRWRRIEVVAEVIRADDAVRAAAQFRPQIILTASDMEGSSVVDLVRRVQEASAESQVMVFTGAPDPALHSRLRAAAVRGYVLWTDVTPLALHHALATVLETDLAVESVAAMEALAEAPERRRRERVQGLRFTERERAVLGGLAAGLTRAEIGKAEGISVRMVGRTITDLLEKVGVPNVRALVAVAVELGFGAAPAAV